MKKLIILLLAMSLSLVTGCSKEQEEAGLWVNMAKEELEANEEWKKDLENQFKPIELYPYKDEDTLLFGYINLKGDTVVQPQFKRAEKFDYTNRLAVVLDEQDRMNYIDENGELLLKEFKYMWLGEPKAGLVAFADSGDTCGVIDFQGNIIVPQEYERVDIKEDGYISFKKNDKYGMMDNEGNVIIEPIYDQVYGDSSGIIIKHEEMYGIYDKDGKEVFPIIYDEIEFLHKDLIGLKDENNKYAMYNMQGEKLTEHVYDRILRHGKTFIAVCKDGKYGYIDQSGEIVVDIVYEELSISTLDPRYAQIKVEGKYGIIDMYGEYLLEPKYDFISPGFREDGTIMDECFIVKEGEKRNLVDKDGNILREDIYSGLMICEDYIIGLNNDYNYILLDLKGNDIAKYEYLLDGGDYMLVKEKVEDQLGFVVEKKTGKVITEEKYESIQTSLKNNLVIATKNDLIYFMNEKCEVLATIYKYKYGSRIGNIEIKGKDLIKVELEYGGFLWINSKGELVK